MLDIFTRLVPDDSQSGYSIYDFSEGSSYVSNWTSYSFSPLDSISWPENFKNEFIKWSQNIFVVAPPPPESRTYAHGDILRSWRFPSFEDFVTAKSSVKSWSGTYLSLPPWIRNINPRAEELIEMWNNSTITDNLTPEQRDIILEATEITKPYREITKPQNLVGLSLYDVYLAHLTIARMPTITTYRGSRYNHEEEVAKSEQIKRTYDAIKNWIENRQGIESPSMSIDENFTDFYTWALSQLKPQYQYWKQKRDSETGPLIQGIQWSMNTLQHITEVDESYIPETSADNYEFVEMVEKNQVERAGPDPEDYDEDDWEAAWDDYDWSEDYGDYPLELRLAVIDTLQNLKENEKPWGLQERFTNHFDEITNDFIMGVIRTWEQDFNGTTKQNWSFHIFEPNEAMSLLNLNYEFSPNSVSISYNLPEPQPNETYVLLTEDEANVFLKYKYFHQLSFQVLFPFINYIVRTPKYL